MTDIRKCDSPECSVEIPIDEPLAQFGRYRADTFIELNRPNGRPTLHFHNDRCLVKWTRGNNRAN